MKFKIFLVLIMSASLYAGGDCTEWYKTMRTKYKIVGTKTGIVMDKNGEWLKLFGEGVASVDFNDEDERQDSLDEAEMNAKAAIAHFMKEGITDENTFNNISKKMKDLKKISKNSTKMSINKKSIKIKIQKITNNASSLLKGVLPLCRSVKDGKAIVVVGVSPKTQRAADSARKSMYQDNTKIKDNGGYIEKSTQKNYMDSSDSLDF